jgi:RimJ/RimL family protein N-acetyltransferase
VHQRPIAPAEADADLAALLDIRFALRVHTGSEWPPDDWSLADDQADVQHDHDRRATGEAFTFTSLETRTAQVVGCVYLWPAAEHRTRYGPDAAPVDQLGMSTASVEWWLQPPWEEGPFERQLVTALRQWLEREWRFPRAVWPVREYEARQARVLQPHAHTAAHGAVVLLQNGRSPGSSEARVPSSAQDLAFAGPGLRRSCHGRGAARDPGRRNSG